MLDQICSKNRRDALGGSQTRVEQGSDMVYSPAWNKDEFRDSYNRRRIYAHQQRLSYPYNVVIVIPFRNGQISNAGLR